MMPPVKTIFGLPGMVRLLFAQSQVAFNDNAVKLILIGLVQLLLPAEQASSLVSLIALLLVAPFLLFAPLTGWLADRFPNRDVLAGSLLLQLAVMGLLFLGTMLHSIPLAIGGFFLLGLQSALMSPARRGLVKNLAGDRVGEAIGWMEMLCIVAILGGSLAGGFLIDGLKAELGDPWKAAQIASAALAAGCAVAFFFFLKCPRHPAPSQTPFTAKTLVGHIDLLKTLRQDRSLWWAAIGDSVFYLGGGILMLTFAEIGRHLHPSGEGAARATGIMMAILGGGIAVGSVVAARLSRHQINLGLVPLGAAGMAVTLAVLAFLPLGHFSFYVGLLFLGASGGLFVVPLGAFLVDRSPSDRRGQILAAASMLSSFTGLVAVGVHALLSRVFGWGASEQFLFVGVLLLAVAAVSLHRTAPHFLRFLALVIARRRYKVKTLGVENLPKTGGALLVCNHVSYVDTIILSLAAPRPIRFISYEGIFSAPILGPVLRLFGTIPISPAKARSALTRAAECIRQGEIVCIFPEGQLTRTGSLMELKSGFEIITRRAQCPTIVAHMDGLWGSIYSFEGGRYFKKWPKSLRRSVTVSFAPALRPDEATTDRVREILLDLGATAFASRQLPTLPRLLTAALLRQPVRHALRDESGRTFTAVSLWYGSLALAGLLRAKSDDRRVGLILPPGPAGTIANLALLLTRRVPVNLNPLAAPPAATACLEVAGIQTVLTSIQFKQKLPNYPWPAGTFFIEDLLAASESERFFAFLRGLGRLLLGGSRSNDEAALLFTSGSGGLPQGVPLTHRNLVSNLTQVRETSFLQPDDCVLTALPLFHSFGLVMGLLLPLVCGRKIIATTSPLDCEKLAAAARQDAPTILLTTPTFLRTYTRRIPRDAFGTLRLAVTGAEKLPPDIAAAFRTRFGCDVVEGYGLTETSPVAAINVPHPGRGLGADSFQPGWKAGSVGRLVPGLALRFFEDGRHKPGATRGILALRGPNVTRGYLHGSSEKFSDGWFVTGDVAHLDAEGFLFIEGRVSRFSKIGGEMVSHVAVEQAIAQAAPKCDDALDCVVGCPCPEKGERLILLTNRAITREFIRAAFAAAEMPNLWLPRDVIRLEAFPTLASGKLDLASCRSLATQYSAK